MRDTIAGSNYSTTFTYDSYGRLSTRAHSSGITETMYYNSEGYLSSISAGGATRYTVTGINARGQLTAATYGSNLNATFGFDSYGYPTSTQTGSVQDYRYSFDATTGNLSSRQNHLRNKSESFSYDNLYRLTGVTGPQNLSMTYNDNGNISTKSDIGTSAFGYGSSAGPYALTGLESSTSVIPTFDQDVTYNSFQKVSSISENDTTATFIYNSDNERAKMVVTDSGNTILTRWYPSGSYMKETVSGTTSEYTYIGGDAYTAPVVAVTSGGTTNYYYLLRDHLGNVTHQVNTSNTVVAEYSYDAWGRRRNPADWSYNLNNEPALFAGRGFTGHEHLQWFNLINMNGRLYDPLVGRMLSPDPNVQIPDYTQNYNRYSYALNNPLINTDPDGEFIHLIIGAIMGGVINWVTHGAEFNAEGLGYFGIGAATGALSAGVGVGIQTASSGASFWAGFVGSTQGISTILSVGYTSSFINGFASGAGAGFVAGFGTGLGNGLMGGQSFGDAMSSGTRDGLIGGVSGGLTGGLIGGIDAVRQGRDFWNGEKWKIIIDYKLPNGNLPIKMQADKNVGCTESTLESINEYNGYYVDVPVNPNGADFAELAPQYGYRNTYHNFNDAGRVGNEMLRGNASAITYNNGGIQHTVGINRITRLQLGNHFNRIKNIIQVMDPLFDRYRNLPNSLFKTGVIRTVGEMFVK